MNPLLEPFVYEAVAEHQHELREAARTTGSPTRAEGAPVPRPRCLLVRWRAGEHGTAVPCLARLLEDPR
jgi:hypothetical protein